MPAESPLTTDERSCLVAFILEHRPAWSRERLEQLGRSRGNRALESILDTLMLADGYETQFSLTPPPGVTAP